MSSRSALLLQRQLKDLNRHPLEGFSAGLEDDSNVYKWSVCLMGPEDTLYEGGIFNATLTFPENFPDMPPEMRFTTPIWHPNVYQDGRVCISILHPPGDDPLNPQETSDLRWRPIHTVESIVLSVIAMLSDPNDDSPANLDAAKEWREDPDTFKTKVRRCVIRSQDL